MVKIHDIGAEKLAKAVALWTGYDSASCPTRDDSSLSRAYPDHEAARLVQAIKVLEDDFYKSDAHKTAADFSEMRKLAVSDFETLYPELPSEIADAFAWCYTFDYQ